MASGIICLAIATFLVIHLKADDLDFLTRGKKYFTMQPQKWPAYHVVMGSDAKGRVLHATTQTVGSEGKFRFRRVKKNKPYFYIKSKKWKKWYVYMTDTTVGIIEGTRRRPGSKGQWKVTPTSNGTYALSPKKWSDWYMCMKDDFIGVIIGCPNKEGPESRFLIS